MELTNREIEEWVNSPVADVFQQKLLQKNDELIAKLIAPYELGSVDNSQEAYLTFKNQSVGIMQALEIFVEMKEGFIFEGDLD